MEADKELEKFFNLSTSSNIRNPSVDSQSVYAKQTKVLPLYIKQTKISQKSKLQKLADKSVRKK